MIWSLLPLRVCSLHTVLLAGARVTFSGLCLRYVIRDGMGAAIRWVLSNWAVTMTTKRSITLTHSHLSSVWWWFPGWDSVLGIHWRFSLAIQFDMFRQLNHIECALRCLSYRILASLVYELQKIQYMEDTSWTRRIITIIFWFVMTFLIVGNYIITIFAPFIFT